MEKNKFQKLSGNDLDKLLNRAFLDLDLGEAGNEAIAESISKRVLVKQNPGVLVKQLFFNKFFFIVSLLSFTASVFTYLHTKTDNTYSQPFVSQGLTMPVTIIKTEKTIQPEGLIPEKTNCPKIEKTVIKTHRFNPPATIDLIEEKSPGSSSFVQTQSVFPTPMVEPEGTQEQSRDIPQTQKSTPVIPERYLFPNLTQKQRKENENEKKWMAKLAAKLKQDKSIEKYVRIPESTDKSVMGFYISSGEITNLNYRTFLFDLLLNERKEEFLIAKPLQSLWVGAAGVNFFDTLSAIYFSDATYNDYPVVNISVSGAELYCEWLTVLANEIRAKEGKSAIEVRLPYEKEWSYAANVGHNTAVYPWLHDSIQNNENIFLANFCIRKQTNLFKQPIVYPNGFDANAYTSAGMASNNNKNATFLTWSYAPNDFQLYNMCGNVSEMVYTAAKRVKTKGGNWNSDFEHLKLNSEDEFKDGLKPSPMLGFRVCIIEKK